MRLDKKRPPKKKGKKVTVLQCPHCNGTNVGYWSGYRPSGSYECYDCDYKGSFVIKKEAWIDEDGEVMLTEDPPAPDVLAVPRDRSLFYPIDHLPRGGGPRCCSTSSR